MNSERHNNRAVRVEQRDDGNGKKRVLIGYAAVFHNPADSGTEFRMDQRVVERVGRSAFDRSLSEKRDVICAVNHDPSQLLGRTSSGTMQLIVDSDGLRYEVDLPDTQLGRDVETMINRRDFQGSSFRFAPGAKSKWTDTPSLTIRELIDLDLRDVGPVTSPAYKGTSVGLRSDEVEAALAELEAERTAQRQEADRVSVAVAIYGNRCGSVLI